MIANSLTRLVEVYSFAKSSLSHNKTSLLSNVKDSSDEQGNWLSTVPQENGTGDADRGQPQTTNTLSPLEPLELDNGCKLRIPESEKTEITCEDPAEKAVHR